MSKPDSQKRRRELEGRLHSIEAQTEKLYEDKVMGAISNDELSRLSQQLEDDRREKSSLLVSLKRSVSEVKEKLSDIERWISLIEKNSALEGIDRDLLESLIDRIEIGGRDVINGLKTQGVGIIFKYAGQGKKISLSVYSLWKQYKTFRCRKPFCPRFS